MTEKIEYSKKQKTQKGDVEIAHFDGSNKKERAPTCNCSLGHF